MYLARKYLLKTLSRQETDPPFELRVDCLQSVFSLKIRLVFISSSAIANYDVIITIETIAARGFAARVLRFRVQ